MDLTPGTTVEATTASGKLVRMVVLRAPEQGRDFPVVWLATPEEYERALSAQTEPEGLPWPLDDVRELARQRGGNPTAASL